MKCYRRLPLNGLVNARDLGGFPAENGSITKYGVFVRSELPAELSQKDIDFLLDYGIRLSIDVRGKRETENVPSVLKDVEGIRYENISIFNDDVAAGDSKAKQAKRRAMMGWGETYIEMIEDGKDWSKKVLTQLASETAVSHYHCTTGKDRTGMITAMILGVCGVSDEDIIADYCISQVNMRSKYLKMKHFLPVDEQDGEVDLSNPFFSTAPDNMFQLLEFLHRKYDTMENYLKSCGIEDETIHLLKTKFLENAN